VSGVGLPQFAVVDLETSGLSTRWNRILQIGLVRVDATGRIVDEWSTLVKLRWPLQRVGPTAVHGITRSSLRGAPRLDVALDELGRRLDGALFTAHNAEFDAAFLGRAARRRPVDDPLRVGLAERLCTLRLSQRLDPERQLSHRLGDVCVRYDVVLDRPHDALADAAATAAVLPHLLAAHGITDRGELAPFIRPRRGSDTGRASASPVRSPAAPLPGPPPRPPRRDG
jgi:DNA polymerase-3 subunit epsilon